MPTDKPEPGKVYRLTGADVPSIANGDSWRDSEIPQPPLRELLADHHEPL